MKPIVLAITAALGLSGAAVAGDYYSGYSSYSDEKEITIIHMGDIHGHTTPRDNVRSDGDGRMEGGLARMYTKIKKIRGDKPQNTLLVNTGDTLQGSGEAMYSRGQAMVDVLDMFGIQAYAPGNWDYVYGPARFKEFFVNAADPSKRRWGGIVSNLYVADAAAPKLRNNDGSLTQPGSITWDSYNAYTDWYLANGVRLLPPYEIKTINGIKVGIIGCTTNRGPQVVGNFVTQGLAFTDCDKEVAQFAALLRPQVDFLMMISEIELGRNMEIVKKVPGIDLILNSDMHEETSKPIAAPRAGGGVTLIVEEGQDGTMLGEMELEFKKDSTGKYVLKEWEWKAHRIHDGIAEDPAVAAKVAQVRAPYTTGFTPNTHLNPFSGTYLKGSLDEVVGTAGVDLHRSGYSDDAMAAVIEGTSHNFVADAIRWWAKSDAATVRGFRYGTHVKKDKGITRGDLFHFVPIGPRVAKVSRIHGGQLRNQIDNSSLTVLSSDPNNPTEALAPGGNFGWAGGWLFAYSGPTFKFDPYYERIPGQNQSRSRAIKMTLPCARLPAAEKPACEANGTGMAETTLNNDQASKLGDGTKNNAAGAWTLTWNATLPGTGVQVFDLTPEGWTTTSSVQTKQNALPTATVAGYWYELNPYVINNCNNCVPRGLVNNAVDEEHPDAPWLLPVNMDPATGMAMLDSNNKPILKRDSSGAIVRNAKNVPQVDGVPIDLTEIIEKYLVEIGKVANPVGPRITLVNPLPGRASNDGVPFMQPLCGTVGKDPAAPYVCPTPAP